ncbi:PilZ domain-containing protein [Sphingomonas faeni]|uniref:PilZ domain-containing protein n=1 Tax=Sphingomonas faeni TaxID=185950 RepID=UPI003364FB5D
MADGPPTTKSGDHATAPREPRQSVFLSATLERFGSAEVTKHRVRDLSPQGMRIDQTAGLRVGATVLVSIGQLEAVGAMVVWIKDGFAGLRFATTVDPDKARGRAAVRPKASMIPRREEQRGATMGWVADLNDPYRK